MLVLRNRQWQEGRRYGRAELSIVLSSAGKKHSLVDIASDKLSDTEG